MNPAYIAAALASVFYGGADFCGGFAARRGDVWAVTFVSGFGALAVLLLGLPFLPGVTRGSDLAWASAAGVCGGIGAMLIFRALALGPVSVASPVLCVVGLTLPVLVGLGLGERPGRLAVLGLALVPVAIVLLARGNNEPGGSERARRVLWPAILAGLVAGAFLVCFGRIERGAGLWPIVLGRIVGMGVLAAALVVRRKPLFGVSGSARLALASGALDSVANVTYVLAVQRGQLSLVAALVSLSPATALLLARIVLHERLSGSQRVGFAAAMMSGAMISLG